MICQAMTCLASDVILRQVSTRDLLAFRGPSLGEEAQR